MAVDLYGATIDGVQALLPWWKVGTTDQGTQQEAIEGWLAEGAADVAGRIGDISGLASNEALRVRAAGLVHLYAAAVAEDANHPERTGNERRYAATLWERYLAGLEALAAAVADERDDTVIGSASAAGHFPEPFFTRDMRL